MDTIGSEGFVYESNRTKRSQAKPKIPVRTCPDCPIHAAGFKRYLAPEHGCNRRYKVLNEEAFYELFWWHIAFRKGACPKPKSLSIWPYKHRIVNYYDGIRGLHLTP
jgi:hypothetical protein